MTKGTIKAIFDAIKKEFNPDNGEFVVLSMSSESVYRVNLQSIKYEERYMTFTTYQSENTYLKEYKYFCSYHDIVGAYIDYTEADDDNTDDDDESDSDD